MEASNTDGQSLNKEISKQAFVVFDTETSLRPSSTSGSSAYFDLVEIGCIVTSLDSSELQTFESLVKPYFRFNAASCVASHITEEVLETAPILPQVFDKLVDLFAGSILVGQNTQYDIRVLRMGTENYFELGHLDATQRDRMLNILSRPHLDTKKLFSRLFPGEKKKSLDKIANVLAISLERKQRHTALADAQLTLKVFRGLVKLAEEHGVRTVSDLLSFQNGQFAEPTQLSLF